LHKTIFRKKTWAHEKETRIKRLNEEKMPETLRKQMEQEVQPNFKEDISETPVTG
jgi:hypothetical protein